MQSPVKHFVTNPRQASSHVTLAVPKPLAPNQTMVDGRVQDNAVDSMGKATVGDIGLLSSGGMDSKNDVTRSAADQSAMLGQHQMSMTSQMQANVSCNLYF